MSSATDVTVPDGAPAYQAGSTYGAWVAGTGRAPVSNHAGSPHTRTLLLAGFERSYRLAAGLWGRLATSPALLPGVYATKNYRGEFRGCGTFDLCVVGVPYAAYGVGVLPLSLQYQSPGLGRVSLGLRGDAGAVYFTRRIPAPSGTRLNFAAQYGGDLVVQATRRVGGVVGYRHLHLSNGSLGDANPGIDAPLVSLGLRWR